MPVPDLVTTAEASVEEARDLTPEMSMTELVQWMGSSFGGLTVIDALQQAAFMLCCDVISQDIAKSTLRLRERLDNGTSKVVLPTKHEVAALLATEPNRRHTWYEFTEMLVLWHCFTKNAFAGVLRDNVDTPLELIPFQSNRVMERVFDREVFYDVSAGTMFDQALMGSTSRNFPERDMIHVRGRLINGMDGYSTMLTGRKTLETGKAIDDYRDDLFSEDGQMRGVFRKKSAGALNDVAFERLRSQLRVKLARLKASADPLILEDDVEFQPISAKPDEMELTKQFQAQVVATARLLRVPPHKIFEMDGAKYENLETQEKMYVGDTLIPIAKQFEARYGKTILRGKDRLRFFFEYDRDDMTLRDSKVETERAKAALQLGGISWDEFRARLGYNPLPEGQGENRIVPVNMTIIDKSGKAVIIGQPDKGSSTDTSSTPADEPAAEPKKGLRLVS